MQLLILPIRKQKGWTLRELSSKSGVSVSHISDIEQGNKMPSIDIICKLAKALKVKPCELFKCD